MQKAAYLFLLGVLGCGWANSAACEPRTAHRFMAQRGWTAYEGGGQIASPVPSVIPLVYEAKGAKAPSCALLTGPAAAPVLVDVWGPEHGTDWPRCLGFYDAARFDLNEREYLVFEYLNQDTHEQTYRRHFYLVKDASGHFVEASEFNSSRNKPRKAARMVHDDRPPTAKEGIALARSISLSNSMGDRYLSDRDFLLDGGRFFGIYQDKSRTSCTFVVDNGFSSVKTEHDAFPDARNSQCEAVLASGKLEHAGRTYYIALYKGVGRRHVAVFSVDRNNVVAVEGSLSAKVVKDGKLPDMKTIKKALAAAIT